MNERREKWSRDLGTKQTKDPWSKRNRRRNRWRAGARDGT